MTLADAIDLGNCQVLSYIWVGYKPSESSRAIWVRHKDKAIGISE